MAPKPLCNLYQSIKKNPVFLRLIRKPGLILKAIQNNRLLTKSVNLVPCPVLYSCFLKDTTDQQQPAPPVPVWTGPSRNPIGRPSPAAAPPVGRCPPPSCCTLWRSPSQTPYRLPPPSRWRRTWHRRRQTPSWEDAAFDSRQDHVTWKCGFTDQGECHSSKQNVSKFESHLSLFLNDTTEWT